MSRMDPILKSNRILAERKNLIKSADFAISVMSNTTQVYFIIALPSYTFLTFLLTTTEQVCRSLAEIKNDEETF